jgi:hypothetical protein
MIKISGVCALTRFLSLIKTNFDFKSGWRPRNARTQHRGTGLVSPRSFKSTSAKSRSCDTRGGHP